MMIPKSYLVVKFMLKTSQYEYFATDPLSYPHAPTMPSKEELTHNHHVNPHALPFHSLPSRPPTCRVTLLHYGWLRTTRQIFVDDGWDDDSARRERKSSQRLDMPLFGALLERSNGDQWVWDLGWRTDSQNLPEMFRKPIAFGNLDANDDCVAQNLLWKQGLDAKRVKGIILSHAHIDHYGALDLFDPSIPCYVGDGTMKWINGGDQQGGLKSFPSSYLEQGRKFIEVKDNPKPIGPFEEAFDFVGDGSMWLVKAPGHCPGHLAMLTHTGNDDWVFLAGDAAHHQSLYLPIPPEPYSHSTDRRSIPALFKMTPEAHSLSCMQDFPERAWHTLSAMTRLEMQDNVMVLLAHEDEIDGATGLKEGGVLQLNEWRRDGLKQKKDQEGDRRREALNRI